MSVAQRPCAAWVTRNHHPRPCRNPATVRVGGVDYCPWHAPRVTERPAAPVAWQERPALLMDVPPRRRHVTTDEDRARMIRASHEGEAAS